MPKIFFSTLATLATSLVLFSPITFAAPPSDAESFMKHLESDGYKVTLDRKKILATHTDELQLHLTKVPGGTLVSTVFTTNSKAKEDVYNLLSILDILNAKAVAATYYQNRFGNIVASGYYPGKYNKASFEIFLKAFNRCKTDLKDKDIFNAFFPYLK